MSSPPSWPSAPGPLPPVPRRVLLMSSNGAGMGHLTRLLAYAAHLPAGVEPYVLSLSQAVPVVAGFGYRYEYLPSHGALGMTSALWQPLFEERLIEVVGRVAPSVVVFDGTHPYRGIDAARAAHPQTRWVWSRRGMWKPGRNADQLAKSAWFDEVIEPGDLAAEVDAGASASAPAYRVGPVTLTEPADLLTREAAREALGLPAQGRIGLVSLGAGNINDTSGEMGAAAAALRAHGCAVAVTDVAIADQAMAADVYAVRAYPLARFYRAFDLVPQRFVRYVADEAARGAGQVEHIKAGLVDVDKHDLGAAIARQPCRAGRADARCRAGDERRAPGKVELCHGAEASTACQPI